MRHQERGDKKEKIKEKWVKEGDWNTGDNGKGESAEIMVRKSGPR